jgi:ribonucleotide monophosphatase NagD (HAD superfamily)
MYADKLGGLGIATSIDDIVNPVVTVPGWLRAHHPDAGVFVIGEEPRKRALTAAGIRLTEDPNAPHGSSTGSITSFRPKEEKKALAERLDRDAESGIVAQPLGRPVPASRRAVPGLDAPSGGAQPVQHVGVDACQHPPNARCRGHRSEDLRLLPHYGGGR